MRKIEQTILSTLAYADIFDYPLTSGELYRFLISDEIVGYSFFRRALTRIITNGKRLPRTAWYWGINTNGEYFFLRGRQEIVNIRKKRERWSREKLKIAQRVAKWLKIIPTIKMVGITGALAMDNSDIKDDIDLLIVTRKNRLWLTRLFTVLLVELIAHRRQPGDKEVADKICLNMFLDEAHLKIPKKEQDLFSAHEVCQLKPIWDRGRTYQKFLKGNRWVERYLPNAIKFKVQSTTLRLRSGLTVSKVEPSKFKIAVQNSKLFSFLILLCNFSFIERLAYRLQLTYMRSKRTTEIVEPHRVRFHPKDCRQWVMLEYHQRLKKLKLER